MTETLSEIFYRSVDHYQKPDHLKVKKRKVWTSISSAEFRTAVEELAAGFESLGLKAAERVGILGENRPEWAFCDLATLCVRGTVVTIYPSLPPKQILYILKDSGVRIVVASNPEQAEKILSVKSEAPELQHVIVMDDTPVLGTQSLSSVREVGRRALALDKDHIRRQAATVRPDDLATLIYTSGTTGDPKGVMLTHGNLGSNVETCAKEIFAILGPADSVLSFLPLCHVFERMGGQYVMLKRGVTIAYAEAFDSVPQNLAEIKPTILISVPRLYEKVMARVRDKVAVAPPLRKKLFAFAEATGRAVFEASQRGEKPSSWLTFKHGIADRLVLSKVRAGLGGNIKIAVSGGAALPREIGMFFGAMGIPILEGYGLTETSPVIAVNTPSTNRLGSVGKPIEGVEVKIAEDGEILTRGPHVMRGYFNKPEATAEVIDRDGFFHTGDIGRLDQDGYLYITDRKKDLIVTSAGKNIAPQAIENILKTHPLIGEIVMVGNARNYPTALVVPNFDNLARVAGENRVGRASREELVANPRVIELVEHAIASMSKDLAQYEKIKKITLLPKEFSIDAGELTPTLKVKRRVVEAKYKDLIDRMYAPVA
ncbi:MAG: long-chain fatty acid--CoA ligase [Vicinamibacteria bacterium]|nr:long-chain fatty acid--CoA ligase [Vicinamibacteria bacterium]